jgi:hypothetical protein
LALFFSQVPRLHLFHDCATIVLRSGPTLITLTLYLLVTILHQGATPHCALVFSPSIAYRYTCSHSRWLQRYFNNHHPTFDTSNYGVFYSHLEIVKYQAIFWNIVSIFRSAKGGFIFLSFPLFISIESRKSTHKKPPKSGSNTNVNKNFSFNLSNWLEGVVQVTLCEATGACSFRTVT